MHNVHNAHYKSKFSHFAPSRYQFPIQNAFALAVHKAQALKIPDATVSLDSLFATGQAYVKLVMLKHGTL